MRTTGKGGYLQYGPGIPLNPRFYRARWLGTIDNAPNGQVGYVELWNGNQRLDRQPVLAGSSGHEHRLAQLDFQLTEPARSVEYRFFVNPGVQMTLERVELFSGLAIPADH